jgi:predicted O-linked N-acetylglucosamine transferase (SPINDLY family)
MPATIARDHAHYVELAVALTRDLEALALMRSGMRERIATSPLCDGAQFARSFEKIMRGVWRSWCAQQPQGFLSA